MQFNLTNTLEGKLTVELRCEADILGRSTMVGEKTRYGDCEKGQKQAQSKTREAVK